MTPVFLDHASFAATWKAVGRKEPPSSSLKITDLRVLVNMILRAPASAGDNWANVRFLGLKCFELFK